MSLAWLRVLMVSVTLVAEPAAWAQTYNGSAVAATVNGETITVDDWITRMQRLQVQDFGLSLPSRSNTLTAGQIALALLVDDRLIVQYAKKVGLVPTEADVDAGVAEAKKRPEIAEALQAKRLTEAALRAAIQQDRTRFNVVTVNTILSSDEVARYYAARQDLYGTPETWHLAVIRVSGKDVANKVAADLKAGKPFGEVAAQYSEDATTKKQGGELGTFVATDPNIPGFIREAVAKLKVGENTPAILSEQPGGKQTYFFMRLLGKKDKVVPPLEQVRPMVERAALLEKAGGGAQKLAELRRDAKIVVSLPGYEEMFKK